MDAFEHFENAFLVLGFYADAVVRKGDADLSLHGFDPDPDAGRDAGEDEFDGVAYKVGDALDDGGFMAHDVQEAQRVTDPRARAIV
jgi:hypothetical protein